MVACGLRMAWRLATCPTSRCPSSVNATTDGVVRPPSAFGMTSARPPSITAATTEFVVPRSIPTPSASPGPLSDSLVRSGITDAVTVRYGVSARGVSRHHAIGAIRGQARTQVSGHRGRHVGCKFLEGPLTCGVSMRRRGNRARRIVQHLTCLVTEDHARHRFATPRPSRSGRQPSISSSRSSAVLPVVFARRLGARETPGLQLCCCHQRPDPRPVRSSSRRWTSDIDSSPTKSLS
jgi:hypothetical protein